jgi:hypothetical protein
MVFLIEQHSISHGATLEETQVTARKLPGRPQDFGIK